MSVYVVPKDLSNFLSTQSIEKQVYIYIYIYMLIIAVYFREVLYLEMSKQVVFGKPQTQPVVNPLQLIVVI